MICEFSNSRQIDPPRPGPCPGCGQVFATHPDALWHAAEVHLNLQDLETFNHKNTSGEFKCLNRNCEKTFEPFDAGYPAPAWVARCAAELPGAVGA